MITVVTGGNDSGKTRYLRSLEGAVYLSADVALSEELDSATIRALFRSFSPELGERLDRVVPFTVRPGRGGRWALAVLATAIRALLDGTRRLAFDDIETGLSLINQRYLIDELKYIALAHQAEIWVSTHSRTVVDQFEPERVVCLAKMGNLLYEARLSSHPMAKLSPDDEATGEFWANTNQDWPWMNRPVDVIVHQFAKMEPASFKPLTGQEFLRTLLKP